MSPSAGEGRKGPVHVRLRTGVAVRRALPTGLCPTESTGQVLPQSTCHGAKGAGHRLDVVLLERSDGSSSHASGDDHVGTVFPDEGRHLSRLVISEERVRSRRHAPDDLVLYVGQHVEGAPSEVRAHDALETPVLVDRDRNPHVNAPPRRARASRGGDRASDGARPPRPGAPRGPLRESRTGSGPRIRHRAAPRRRARAFRP